MNIEPLFNYVLVNRDEEKEVSNGGIILPDAVQEKPSTGVVLAVGKGTYEDGVFVPTTVKVGDRVLFPRSIGNEVEEDKRIIILKETELMGIIV